MMFTGRYRRIYHFHLKKCGGSTLNRWLDTITFDERTWKGFSVTGGGSEESKKITPSRARTIFHCSDIVHDHDPIRIYAPEKTFCLTVLRDPVQRLVSQVSDLRRLRDADTVGAEPGLRECVTDSRRLPLRDFLEKHANGTGKFYLDNYMTRALAAARIGNHIGDTIDPDRLCNAALHGLERDYDLVGLTELLDLTRNALCAMVGLPPARAIPTVNATRTAGDSGLDFHGLDDILDSLTRIDRILYDRARQLFDRRHRQTAKTYDTAAFETHHATHLLGEARGVACNGATRYSVRSPIVGSGFHGRDGSGMASCAVWSGPETSATLYIPTPPDMPLTLLVWIRGYANIRQRDQLQVRVDGRPAAHHFECADNYADVLAVDTSAARDFVRLEIDVGETLESGDPGSEHHDSRKRGFAFDSYGWRPV